MDDRHAQRRESDEDEYAQWRTGATSILRAEGPAAAMAKLKRQRKDDDDMDMDTDMDILRDDDPRARPNRDTQGSRWAPAAGFSKQADDETKQQYQSDEGKALSGSNIGHQLLLKLGWAGRGSGLGSHAQGRADPLVLSFAKLGADTSGIGKLRSTGSALDDALALSRLYELTSEKIATETSQERAVREEGVRKREEVRSEVLASLSSFRCELCDKQYANATQMEEHTNSYGHHHRKRLRELAANQKALLAGSSSSSAAGGKSAISASERRREKERKREEKEMRAFASAAGVSIGTTLNTARSSAPSTRSFAGTNGGFQRVPSVASSTSGFKKIGGPSAGFRKIGPTTTLTTTETPAPPGPQSHSRASATGSTSHAPSASPSDPPRQSPYTQPVERPPRPPPPGPPPPLPPSLSSSLKASDLSKAATQATSTPSLPGHRPIGLQGGSQRRPFPVFRSAGFKEPTSLDALSWATFASQGHTN
ncbi:hypothetical protein V8E36_009170 [Tilletia maclaganii]